MTNLGDPLRYGNPLTIRKQKPIILVCIVVPKKIIIDGSQINKSYLRLRTIRSNRTMLSFASCMDSR